MHTEIEERVLEVNVEEITKRLEDLNALKVGEWNQKRYVYDFNPKRENEWIRLRDTGEQITLTYKNVEKNSIDGTKELEVEVSDFEETNQLLKILGYNPKGYQENKRIRYILNDVETDEDKENVNNFITGFVMKIMFGSLSNGGFTGGGTTDMFPITDEPTNTVTNTVTDPISNTIPDITNTVIEEPTVIETPSVDVKSYSMYNNVLEEVKNVLTACITESQNNQMDITNYLNVGNLTANCPSLLTATLEKIDDSKFEGILTDMEGKQYKLVVDVNGFSSLTFDIVNP